MHINRKSEYAIFALSYIAAEPRGTYVPVTDIVRRAGVPRALLLKILHHLVKQGILESRSGAHGGYKLAKDPAHVTLLEILNQFEKRAAINSCATCGARCSLAATWFGVQKDIDRIFRKITLKQLARTAKRHHTQLPLKHA